MAVFQRGYEDQHRDNDSPLYGFPPEGVAPGRHSRGRWLAGFAAGEAKQTKGFPDNEDEESGNGQEGAESNGVHELAEIMRPVKGAGPGAKDGSDSDQDGRDDKERALPEARCRGVANEAPYDVIGIYKVSENTGEDEEIVNLCLVTIFEVGRLHSV